MNKMQLTIGAIAVTAMGFIAANSQASQNDINRYQNQMPVHKNECTIIAGSKADEFVKKTVTKLNRKLK